MVGPATSLLGVVADSGALGMAVDDEHDRVEIEGQAAPRPWSREQRLAQLVVQADELPDVPGVQPPEEPSQGGLIREATEPYDALERSIVLQDLGRIDAIHPCNDRVDQRDEHVGRVIVPVARRRSQRLLQEALEAKALAEGVNQRHPREVGQMGFLERDGQIAEPFRHCTQSYPWGTILCNAKTVPARPLGGPEIAVVRSDNASLRINGG